MIKMTIVGNLIASAIFRNCLIDREYKEGICHE